MQPPQQYDDSRATLSIGAVSKATGIPVETLRTWERRYGFPMPERNAAGHRKYTTAIIPHLNLINQALDRGHRPANVVNESPDTLRALLDLTDSASSSPPPEPAPPSPRASAPVSELADDGSAPLSIHDSSPGISAHTSEAVLMEWMDATLRLDAQALNQSFERSWFKLGALNFLEKLVTPFLQEVGKAWFEGRLAVLHEQLASNQLRRFLSAHWRPMSERASGHKLVCAALPGEYHAIGLHMIAVVMAMAGCQITFLGCDTPIGTITQAAHATPADAVLVSVSAAANAATVHRQFTELAEALDDEVELLVGGAGAPPDLPRATRFESLSLLYDWAAETMLGAARRA